MLRILFALYLPLMLAPIPAGAAAKKAAVRKTASKPSLKLADNYDTKDLSYTLEIKVEAANSKTKKK